MAAKLFRTLLCLAYFYCPAPAYSAEPPTCRDLLGDDARLLALLDLNAWLVGPNCWNTALLAFYPEMEIRHVAQNEYRYFIGRDFVDAGAFTRGPQHFPTAALQRHDIVDFDGHVALYLANRHVFQRADFHHHRPYEIISIDDTHLTNGFAPGTRIDDRHARPPSPYAYYQIRRFDRKHFVPAPPIDPELDFQIRLARHLGDVLFNAIHGEAGGRLVDRAVEGTAEDLRHRLVKLLGTDYRRREAHWGTERVEAILRLESLSDGYWQYIDERFYVGNSPSDEKFEKNNRAALTPSPDHAPTWELARRIADFTFADQSPEERQAQATELIARAREVYDWRWDQDWLTYGAHPDPKPPFQLRWDKGVTLLLGPKGTGHR